jgi:hypothetical protein
VRGIIEDFLWHPFIGSPNNGARLGYWHRQNWCIRRPLDRWNFG